MILIQQLAVVSEDIDRDVARLTLAGYDEWVRDEVTAQALVVGTGCIFRARLAFNYQMMDGVEFELIQPLTKPSYVSERGVQPGSIAHVGRHVDDEDEMAAAINSFRLDDMLQVCTTTDHTNPKVPPTRRYMYSIYESNLMPWPVKLIQRLELGALSHPKPS